MLLLRSRFLGCLRKPHHWSKDFLLALLPDTTLRLRTRDRLDPSCLRFHSYHPQAQLASRVPPGGRGSPFAPSALVFWCFEWTGAHPIRLRSEGACCGWNVGGYMESRVESPHRLPVLCGDGVDEPWRRKVIFRSRAIRGGWDMRTACRSEFCAEGHARASKSGLSHPIKVCEAERARERTPIARRDREARRKKCT